MPPAEPVLTQLNVIPVFFCDKDGLAVGCHFEAVQSIDLLLQGNEKSISAVNLLNAQHVPCPEGDPLVFETLEAFI